MSCSKLSPTTPVKLLNYARPCPSLYEEFETNGHLYTRRTDAFIIKTPKGEMTYYLLQSFKSPKKDKLETACAFLWEVLGSTESLSAPDDVTMMRDDTEVREIKCEVAIEELMSMPKRLVAQPFTSNDFCFSSHKRGNTSNYCIEHKVIGEDKTRVVRRLLSSTTTREDRYKFALTNPHITSDSLRDIVSNQPNETRFTKRAPAELGKEARKVWEAEARQHVNAQIRSMTPDKYCELENAWLDRNLAVDHMTDPVIVKEQIGGQLPMPASILEVWNILAPLCFYSRTADWFHDNWKNLSLAAISAYGTWIAEITPKDQRWGVSPPEGKTLSWGCDTPQGKRWLTDMVRTHGGAQEEFMDALKLVVNGEDNDTMVCVEKAFDMLTHGLNEFMYGILGLVKRITLATLTGELKFSNMLILRIQTFFEDNGLQWRFRITEIIQDTERGEDPFKLLETIGEEHHIISRTASE
jgi:hypothetical protein